jgi:hypothetical protein
MPQQQQQQNDLLQHYLQGLSQPQVLSVSHPHGSNPIIVVDDALQKAQPLPDHRSSGTTHLSTANLLPRTIQDTVVATAALRPPVAAPSNVSSR